MTAIKHFSFGSLIFRLSLLLSLFIFFNGAIGGDLDGHIFEGRSSPISGSKASLMLPEDLANSTQFQWHSEDTVLGIADTGVANAQRWHYMPGSPDRLVFVGSGNSVRVYGNLIFSPYDRGVVDVIKGAKRVRYQLRRETPNPEILELNREHAETFFTDDAYLEDSLESFYQAKVNWKAGTPGKVTFDINGGNKKDQTGDLPEYKQTYRLEDDLKPAGVNEIGVVATSTEGHASPHVTLTQGSARVPVWMQGVLAAVDAELALQTGSGGPYDIEVIYDADGLWPKPPFEYVLIGVIPDWVPWVGGIDTGFGLTIKETALILEELRVSSLGPGRVKGGTKSGVEVVTPVIEVAIPDVQYGAKGKLQLVPGELQIVHLTLNAKGKARIGKVFTVGKLPGLKSTLKNLTSKAAKVPGIGRYLRRFLIVLRRSALKLEGTSTLGGSTSLKEELPGFLNTGLTFDSGSLSKGDSGKASLTISVIRKTLDGALGIELGSDHKLTVDAQGTSFIEIFGHDGRVTFVSNVDMIVKHVAKCFSAGGLFATLTKPAGSFTPMVDYGIWTEKTKIDCELDGFTKGAWTNAKQAWAWVGNLWPWSIDPTEQALWLAQTIPTLDASIATGTDQIGVVVFSEHDNAKLGISGVGRDIFAARWDGSSWDGPVSVTDDTAHDLNPVVRRDNTGKALVLWERIGAPLTEDPAFDEAFLSTFEIAYAVMNTATGTWAAPQLLTNNSYIDRDPLLAPFGAGLIGVWIGNPGNLLEGDADDPDSIYYATWDGSQFSAPSLALADTNATDLTLATGAGIAALAWVEDGSEIDLDTLDVTNEFDQELYFATFDGNNWSPPLALTDDEQTDSAPELVVDSTGNLTLAWVKETVTRDPLTDEELSRSSALMAMNRTGGAWGAPRVLIDGIGFSTFDLQLNGAGDLMIVFSQVSEGGGPGLYYLVWDRISDELSPVRSLTRTPGTAMEIKDLASADDRVFVAFTNSEIEPQTLDLVDEETGEPVTIETGLPGTTSLSILTHHVFTDVSIGPDDLSLSDPAAGPGESITVSVQAHNSGDLSVPTLEVLLEDELGTMATETITDLAPGASQSLDIPWTVPAGAGPQSVTATLDPNDLVDEWHEDNNSASRETLLPDLAVIDMDVAQSETNPDQWIVTAMITNLGASTPTGNLSLGVFIDEDDDPIHANTLLPPDPGQEIQETLEFPRTGLDAGVHRARLILDPNSDIDEVTRDNNSADELFVIE